MQAHQGDYVPKVPYTSIGFSPGGIDGSGAYGPRQQLSLSQSLPLHHQHQRQQPQQPSGYDQFAASAKGYAGVPDGYGEDTASSNLDGSSIQVGLSQKACDHIPSRKEH